MTDRRSPKSTVLIVDDSPANIKVLGEALKPLYRVKVATSGEKALDISISPDPPDLVLLDIIMPDMNGYEVCRKLKENRLTENIPVIFITAMGEEKDEARGLSMGAVDYITKPFSLEIVKARLKTHIELKRHQDILENLSTMDGLTGLPNRRRLDQVLAAEWAKHLHSSLPLSLIILDIDHFKLFNDNFGHLAGDDCLKTVANLLKKTVHRPLDLVARFGGEEFVILLPATDAEGGKLLAETFMNNLSEEEISHPFSPTSKVLTCSMGMATITPAKEDGETELLESADKCLYQAKNSGRNQLRFIEL